MSLLLKLAAVAQWSLWGTGLARADDGDAATGRISVLEEVAVDDDVVRLADIARLEGRAAERLGDLEIGRAPSPGRVRVVPGAGILATLRRSGADLGRVRLAEREDHDLDVVDDLSEPVARDHRIGHGLASVLIDALDDRADETQIAAQRGQRISEVVRDERKQFRNQISRAAFVQSISPGDSVKIYRQTPPRAMR